MRARIIALSWDGLRVAAIAGELGCHAKTVRWWLHRFNDRARGAGGPADHGPAQAAHRARAVPGHRPGQAGAARTARPAGERGVGPCRRGRPAGVDAGRSGRGGPAAEDRGRPLTGAADPPDRGRAVAPHPLVDPLEGP
ncbi:helix-turn-helix domain-containing protein [Kitasatospora sp. NBC_01560]|uniref:helix-turn-helix domain-containing protein n=1 Tax=Kitasatospora sp. NBC_01560 TaxID=2975965 RepID=UPI00386E1B53